MAVLAIDLHGGDFGPSHNLPAALRFFQKHPEHQGHLHGLTEACQPLLPKSLPPNLSFHPCEHRLPADLNPAQLLRHSYGSSLESAYAALAEQRVDAVVSAEHTGALMALMHRHAVPHPAVDRPVLVSWVPTAHTPIVMLDLGASFSASSEQLMGFAAIGQAIASQALDTMPSLALLNMGVEANKGPHALRLAAEQLKHWPDIHFRGFVEADQVFQGDLDLVITDGFTGNAVIKAAEGTLDLTLSALRCQLQRDWLGRVLGYLLNRRLKPQLMRLDPRRSNGALLAGSSLTVIKSHGDADALAFQSAIDRAVDAVEGRWCGRVLDRLDRLIQ